MFLALVMLLPRYYFLDRHFVPKHHSMTLRIGSSCAIGGRYKDIFNDDNSEHGHKILKASAAEATIILHCSNGHSLHANIVNT